MSKYVDGFVLVVPTDKTGEYREMASGGRDAWMRHGALEYYECRGDDMTVPQMGPETARAFTEMADAAEGETVWFSFIVFESKAHRDEVNAKVMEEMGQQSGPAVIPFDVTRMAYGGFVVEVEG
jgi:uncharacterized protein YbaA (DUF1428 family)